VKFDGPLLAERWRLGPRLGSGAQARTHLARDEQAEGERVVVIKRLHISDGKTWKNFDLFEREIRTLKALEHEGIPRYLESFESDGGVFNLVMEKAPGASLRSWSKKHKLDEDDLRDITRRTLEILTYLHGLRPPIIHRDIKPANLVRDRDGSISLVDFGAVRDSVRTEGGSTVIGTFGYMAPEQLHGEASAATDIYGLGATMVSLAGGVEPEKVPRKGLRMDLDAHLSSLDPSLRAVFSAMTEPDPSDRPKSAERVLEMLEKPRKKAPRKKTPQKTRALARRESSAVDEIDDFVDTLPAPVRVALRALLFIVGASGWLGLTIARYAALPIIFALIGVVFGERSNKTKRAIESGFDEGRAGFASLASRRARQRLLPPSDGESDT